MAAIVNPSTCTSAQFTSASLYVGDLLPDVTEAVLYDVFNSVGPVSSIRVCRDSLSRRSLGYAYVNYHSVVDAERALDTLNYTEIKGNPARIMWSRRDPSLRKSGAGNIFVKNLDKTIDNKALYDTFSLFGNILSCKVATDSYGKSKSYGFVHYETEHAANQAIDRVNGMQIGGKTVYVAHFIRRNDRELNIDVKYTNIYIKNIPASWDENQIKTLFGKFGTITSMAIKKDKKSRVFGFINYEEPDSARDAVAAMNAKLTTDEGVKENDKEAVQSTSEVDEKEEDLSRLYVAPHQAKSMRQALLKQKFESVQDNKARFQGVNLFIKNLGDTIDDDSLRKAFEAFGVITSAKVMMDEQNVSRGFGFVCFMSPDEATKAVTEMHLKLMHGKPLYVGLAEKREKRVARLQQRYRVPSLRPGGTMGQQVANIPQGPGGQPVNMQFQSVNQPQMYFGGPNNGQNPGIPPPRPIMSFQGQQGVMPWRPQTPRPYQGQQGNIQLSPLGMYGGNMHQIPSQMSGLMSRNQQGSRGPRNNGGNVQGNIQNGVNLQGSIQNIQGSKLPTPMNKQVAGSFKFTTQARNRIDYQSGQNAHGPNGGVNGAQPGSQVGNVGTNIAGNGLNIQGGQNGQNGQNNGQDTIPNIDTPLTAAALAAAPASIQKQMLGEKLFPLIARFQPDLAGKITGMMLEMDNSELLILLESEVQLKAKVEEALRVLQQAQHD